MEAEKIEILLPNGFMNCGIVNGNQLVADTNNSVSFTTITYDLPFGYWGIHSYKNKNKTVVVVKSK